MLYHVMACSPVVEVVRHVFKCKVRTWLVEFYCVSFKIKFSPLRDIYIYNFYLLFFIFFLYLLNCDLKYDNSQEKLNLKQRILTEKI